VAGSDVYLVGGGDPTLSAGLSAGPVGGYPSFASLGVLARKVARSHRVIRRVVGVSPQYGGPEIAPGWSPSYLTDGEAAPIRSLVVDEDKLAPGLGPSARAGDPVLDAAQKFQSALSSAGAKAGPASVGALPTGARVAGAVYSPPVSALVEQMLTFSDDDIAEGLGRQVALRRGLPATFAGTATALEQVAHELGLSPAPHIADASGLSRSDAVAPAALTNLLREAATGDQPRLRGLLAALPVAGFTGTLVLRFRGAAATAAGMVRAKTGWLNGAAALAGIVTTADGRLLAFAALAPAPDRGSGEAALDRLAAVLASCGCR
jgi:D-alanyl-D-alanine carboxypeptidase/D-alanyl-D-alanine-endopeptidase (penicillin-binding protein 4)